MTELTKEQLIEEAKLKIAIAKCHPNSGVARVEGELFKIALTSLEAEPVGEFYEYKPGDWYQRSAGDKAPKWIQLYAVPPALAAPEGLVKAVRFYEQVQRENPPVETGAWKDAVDWVLKEACQVVNTGIKGE
ncbi:hypothetical protein BvCmsNSNP012_00985 [Escherichia coli]|nr:hypothetical protein [Escherichia coli]GDO96315.1 hypothetical protein BvCmsNSNP012_00985 [Escherichia coli]